MGLALWVASRQCVQGKREKGLFFAYLDLGPSKAGDPKNTHNHDALFIGPHQRIYVHWKEEQGQCERAWPLWVASRQCVQGNREKGLFFAYLA